MAQDEDVIELGEDGTFDINSTSSVKQAKTEEIDYSTYDWSKVENLDKLDIVKEIAANEYAIYKKEDGTVLWVILKLAAGQHLSEVVYHKQTLIITTSVGEKVEIVLPKETSVDPKSIKCSCCKEVMTIVMNIDRAPPRQSQS